MSDVHQIDLFDYLMELESYDDDDQFIDSSFEEKQPRKSYFTVYIKKIMSWLTSAFLGSVQWVSVYTATRAFGGQEEGGWYYKRYALVESHLVIGNPDWMKAKLFQRYRDLAWGGISHNSVGLEVVVISERRKASLQVDKPLFDPAKAIIKVNS